MAASAGRFPGPVSSVVLRTSRLSAASEGMEVSSSPRATAGWTSSVPPTQVGPSDHTFWKLENQG